jgi:hypothetical protein
MSIDLLLSMNPAPFLPVPESLSATSRIAGAAGDRGDALNVHRYCRPIPACVAAIQLAGRIDFLTEKAA